MCVGLSAKVVRIQDGMAMVDASGARREVSVQLLSDVEPGDYVMVHAASDGEKTIRLPGTFDAREIFGASPARKGASEIVETMKRGETRVWRLGK